MDDLKPVWSFFKKFYDLVNGNGFIALVIAIAVAFYIYWLQCDIRELSYSVRSNRSILFDAENPLGFELYLPDKRSEEERRLNIKDVIGKSLSGVKDWNRDTMNRLAGFKIEKNVYTAQLLVWNSGTLPIKNENILLPVTISMDLEEDELAEDVLDVRVSDSSRKEINFECLVREPAPEILDDRKTIKRKTDCLLKWNILEPGDYAVVQVVYSGAEDAEILLEGTIEGQIPIQRIQSPIGQSLVTKNKAFTLALFFGLFQILLAWGIAASKIPFMSKGIGKASPLTRGQTAAFLSMMFSFLMMLAYLWWPAWTSFPIEF